MGHQGSRLPTAYQRQWMSPALSNDLITNCLHQHQHYCLGADVRYSSLGSLSPSLTPHSQPLHPQTPYQWQVPVATWDFSAISCSACYDFVDLQRHPQCRRSCWGSSGCPQGSSSLHQLWLAPTYQCLTCSVRSSSHPAQSHSNEA